MLRVHSFCSMITLAIDTCEARGSVAIRKSGRLAALRRHDTVADYSSWLLPAVQDVLSESGTAMDDVQLLAVATGPGSFTGLRVGLTTAKAWVEVYGTPIIGVSRLEAMALSVDLETRYVAAWYDAQRGQMFGALYRRPSSLHARPEAGPYKFEIQEAEMVIAPQEFLSFVEEHSRAESVAWVSLDPGLLTSLEGWAEHRDRGETVIRCDSQLADGIGEIAEERAKNSEFTDVLQLDANYVRRSDAEIFWKGPASHAR